MQMKKQLWNNDVTVDHLTLDCVKCQENMRSTTKEIQKFRYTAINQSTYIKNIIIDFHFGFLGTNNTEKLKDFVRVNSKPTELDSLLFFYFKLVKVKLIFPLQRRTKMGYW